jgi:hypothetical protein
MWERPRSDPLSPFGSRSDERDHFVQMSLHGQQLIIAGYVAVRQDSASVKICTSAFKLSGRVHLIAMRPPPTAAAARSCRTPRKARSAGFLIRCTRCRSYNSMMCKTKGNRQSVRRVPAALRGTLSDAPLARVDGLEPMRMLKTRNGRQAIFLGATEPRATRREKTRCGTSSRPTGGGDCQRASLPPRTGCATLAAMIHDLITAFLVAFAAVTASELLTRIWETF